MIRFVLALVLLVLLALPATAHELPALYSVQGVESDDVLNIRSEPSAQSEIIGMLTPDAAGIEVIAEQNGWGQINTAERAGWVSLNYLRQEQDQAVGVGVLNQLSCSGTEPFWSAHLRQDTLEFEVLEEALQRFEGRSVTTAQGHLGKYAASWAHGASRAVAVVTREACSDGMSDRAYGLSVELSLWPAQGEARLYSGCCNLR